MKFTHLHTHSHYSLLDGLAKIDDLVAKAKGLGMDSLALTDHGSMYGVVEFYEKAKAAGIKPIIGVEFYLAPKGRMEKQLKVNDEKYFHLVLLAKNKTGYKNLIKLTSLGHLEGFYFKPRIDHELLEKYHEGLIALTACLKGEIPFTLRYNEAKAEELILEYAKIFGEGNFYLEVQHHPSLPEQARVNQKLFELGRKLNIPCVATNDIHYLNPEDAEAQDVLLCLQTKRKREDKDRMTMMGEDYSFRSGEQMLHDFGAHPEVISNTQKIVDACNVELELGKIALPHFRVPEDKTAEGYLRELCLLGIEKRFPDVADKKNILDRLEYEMGVIEKTGFASYFLIVQDFTNWAKSNGIAVGPGRGSAAGSIVSYLTGITDIDPLKYDLLFERFLNPERISMPDIDLDFDDRRRDEVIRYVEGKYGNDHVAQIITFGTMAARAVVRDVGRVLGLPYAYCDKVAKLIPGTTLSKALEAVPELRELYERDFDGKRLLDTAMKLEGVARHASRHACGVLITKDPLTDYVPLQHASSEDNTIISQYSLHPIEDLGLLKMDFLGLKNLTIIEDAIDVIGKTTGEKIAINNIPLEDKKTFDLLAKGETTGVFQLESSGMKRYLKELRPTVFEHIIAMVALYRPGPMEWIPDFIAGKQGKKKIKYLHPKLEPILEKTYGVAVYQEQVLQIARDLAGFSLGEADILRKAVGKKIQKLLAEQKEKFVAGAIKNGVGKSIAEQVFAFIEPFAGYGFNRAHAACYAMIAYRTAYLKANWPAQFMAALLTSEGGDTDRIAIEVEECNQMGIEVLPPDINESYSTFTVVAASLEEKKPRIRFGLLAVKNVGEHLVKSVIHERKENGPFKNLEDLLKRVQDKDLNKKSLESLIKCGALDNFGERNQMLGNIERLLNFNKDFKKEAANGQVNLFGSLPATSEQVSLRLAPETPATKEQKLTWEKELLGLYVSEHPFRDFEVKLRGKITPLGELTEESVIDRVKTAGIISTIKRVITRNNETMLFVKLEDTTSSREMLVFPKTLQSNPAIWQEGKMILVDGKFSLKDGEPKIICEEAKAMTLDNLEKIINERRQYIGNNSNGAARNNGNISAKKDNYVIIKIKELSPLVVNGLKNIFSGQKGNYKVRLLVNNKKIETNSSVDYNEEMKQKIEEVVGREMVSLV